MSLPAQVSHVIVPIKVRQPRAGLPKRLCPMAPASATGSGATVNLPLILNPIKVAAAPHRPAQAPVPCGARQHRRRRRPTCRNP